jgi:hypothetical protein
MTLTGSFLRNLHHGVSYRHTIYTRDTETGFYLHIWFHVVSLHVGSVKVWDPRQKGRPVATMEPAEGDARRDCWTVAFGNILMKSDYLLTYLWSWALLEKLPIVQPLKNFPAFYWTRRFITVFTRSLQWSLSWARSTQSTPSHPISLRSILILSTHLRLGLPSGLHEIRVMSNIS